MQAGSRRSRRLTIVVGPDQRLFVAHEDVLRRSPFFLDILRTHGLDSAPGPITLPGEEPEILSAVLEYLYKGDYSPHLRHDKQLDTWALEPASGPEPTLSENIIYHRGQDEYLLKDTVIYCAADSYGLGELKQLALRKQGLRESHPQTHAPIPPPISVLPSTQLF